MANVGLDFGTHQTKICLELGEDVTSLTYRFFPFIDREGTKTYALPSVIQINKDDTLSYGFVDDNICKIGRKRPVPDFDEIEPKEPELKLPKKPILKTPNIRENNVMAAALGSALIAKQYEIAYQNELKEWEEKCIPFRIAHRKALEKYQAEKLAYERKLANWKLIKESADGKMVYRNFKQASFLEERDYPWPYEYKAEVLSVWYLTYILHQLEAYFQDLASKGIGDGMYTIQMGVPTGSKKLKEQQEKAMRLLVSAFKLMNKFSSFEDFLSTNVSDLYNKTEMVYYTDIRQYENDKYYYGINVFPEAYAGLLVMTSKGSLATGFNLLVDIGGGTTDISFFVTCDSSKKPLIYNYDSVPKGLNFILEAAMPASWDKMISRPEWNDSNLDAEKKKEAIEIYLNHVYDSTKKLQLRVYKEWSKSILPKNVINRGLEFRPVIYTGGGSTNGDLNFQIEPAFTVVKVLDNTQWNGLYIDDLQTIIKSGLCPILNVSLGLAITQDNDNIHMPTLEDLFAPHKKTEDEFYDYGHDKDLQSL